MRIPSRHLRTLVSHPRAYSSQVPAAARLNIPTDFSTTPLLNHTSKSALSNVELSSVAQNGSTTRQNLFQSINTTLAHALRSDPSVLLFGEDISFGGVFRCSMNLANEFGDERVFNTPLSEQGIVGFAIGVAMEGGRAIAEVQFADYVYPAFDQLVNEAAKVRFRAGVNAEGQSCGGLVVRMPCGGVGHGALYHSQSPESLFTHIPGLRVVIPRSPSQAKGLLLAAINSNDPVVFLEPKILYRAAVEHVPAEAYELPLSKAEILKQGKDITIISYGTPLYTCWAAIEKAERDFDCSIELAKPTPHLPQTVRTITHFLSISTRQLQLSTPTSSVIMRLTVDLVQHSLSYLNPLKERELDLRGHKIPALENLGLIRDQDAIDFTDNDIPTLANFPLMPRLQALYLGRNRIAAISPNLGKSIGNLHTLVLSQNQISELADLEPLAELKKLTHLTLLENPVTSKENYRYWVIARCPNIRFLDFQKVKDSERTKAKELFGTSAEPSELATTVLANRSSKSAGFNAPANGGSKTYNVKLNEQEKARFEKLIRNAKSLAEITKLERDFNEGKIPPGVLDDGMDTS